jgi:hypothetical protein
VKNIVSVAVAVALSIVSLYAETYYHKGSDGYGNSTFNEVKMGSVGWSTVPNGSIVSSIDDWSGSDFIVNGSANSLRLPSTDDDITFKGKSLTLNDSVISFKRKDKAQNELTRNITIADLRFTGKGGSLSHGESKGDHGGMPTVFCVKGGITIDDDSVMILDQAFNSNNDSRKFVIDSAVTGGESSTITFTTEYKSGANNGTAPVTFNSLDNFYGTFKKSAVSTSPKFELTVNGKFNGSITSLPAGTQFAIFDFDGLPAGKGIRIKGTAPTESVIKKLRVYSNNNTDFTKPGVVVATFEDI